MTCDERKDSILFFAAGEAEPGEAEELRAHLQTGCPQCTGVLAEAQALLALLPQALPMTPAPDKAFQTLTRRIGQGVTGSPLAVEASAQRASRQGIAGRIFAFSAMAAVIAAAVSGGLVWNALHERDVQRQAVVQILDAPQLQLVSLASPKTGAASGNLFWDVRRQQWLLRVANLRPPGAGRIFQLWAIGADGKPISAGTFNTDPSGVASVDLPQPAASTILKTIAITDEPAGGSPGPTGTMQLVGPVK